MKTILASNSSAMRVDSVLRPDAHVATLRLSATWSAHHQEIAQFTVAAENQHKPIWNPFRFVLGNTEASEFHFKFCGREGAEKSFRGIFMGCKSEFIRSYLFDPSNVF